MKDCYISFDEESNKLTYVSFGDYEESGDIFSHATSIDYSNHHEAALMACGGGGGGGGGGGA